MMDLNLLTGLTKLLREKKWKNRWLRVVSVLAAVVVFVTTYALILPAITLEHDLVCDLEEHLHDEDCYEERLTLVCDLEEDEDHVHSEDCYQVEQVLVCGLTEHVHTEECQAVIQAEPPAAETKYDWEQSLGGLELTGQLGADVLAVARSQIGYRGKTLSDRESGKVIKYSRYGDWYGERNGDWNVLFVLFSLHYATEGDEGADLVIPTKSNPKRWIQDLENEGLLEGVEDYVPQPGDLVFFDGSEAEEQVYAGIVRKSDLTNNSLITIEGDRDNQVAEGHYSLDEKKILGYVSLSAEENAAPQAIQAELSYTILKDGRIELHMSLDQPGDYTYDWAYKTDEDWVPLETGPSDQVALDQELLEEGNLLVRSRAYEGDRLLVEREEIVLPELQAKEHLIQVLTETGVEVLLRGPLSSFPEPLEALELRVVEWTEDKAPEDAWSHLRSILEEGLDQENLGPEQTRFFDIDLFLDGQIVQLTGPVEVILAGPGLEGQAQVYHIDSLEEAITDQGAEQTDEGWIVFRADHFSTFAVLLEDLPIISPLATLPPNLIETVDSRAVGMTLNLFDYWATTRDGTYYDDHNGGINQGKNLKFRYSSGSLTGYNNYTNGAFRSADILQSNMGSDGYPVINPPSSGGTVQSSRYLFDPGLANAGKASYADVNHFFKMSNGYYVFDSEENYAFYDIDQGQGGDFAVGSTYMHSNNRDHIGFFPFNEYNSNRRTTNRDNRWFNHFFGLTLEASFQMPPNKQVDGRPMVFNFRGDDDAWVFIDDVLVLDIGGIHDAMTGSINFQTGVVTVQNGASGTITTTIAQQFALAGKVWNDDNYSQHTIKFFYFERGANLSNLKLEFNLPTFPKKDLEISKDVTDLGDDIDPDREYEFQLFINTGADTDFQLYQGPAKYEDGSAVTFATDGTFTIKAGQTVSVPAIDDARRYYIKEVNVDPDDFAVVTFNGDPLTPDDPTGTSYSVTSPEENVSDTFIMYFNNITPASLTKLRVEKVWADGNENHANDSVTFKLLNAHGQEVHYNGSSSFTLNAGNSWEMEFVNLMAQTYTVIEDPLSGYTASYGGYTDEDGTQVHQITNKAAVPPGTIEVDKEWYMEDGTLLDKAPAGNVEVELWRRVCQTTNPTYRTVTFRIRNTQSGHTTFKTEQVPHGGWIEFATGMYTNNKPTGVSSNAGTVTDTGTTYDLPYLQWGQYNRAAVYRLDNVTGNTVVTVDYGYSIQANIILEQSLWYSNISQPGGDSDNCIEELVPNAGIRTLSEANGWSGRWSNLSSASNVKYFVKEVRVDGVPVGSTIYNLTYDNNEGISYGNITVKNTAPVLLVEKKWYRPDGMEYEEAPAQNVELELWRKGWKQDDRTYTVTIRERTGNGSYTTVRTLTVRHGSTLRLAGLYRWQPLLIPYYYRPSSVISSPSGVAATGANHTFQGGSGLFAWSYTSPIYQLTNITGDRTVNMTYSLRLGTPYFWSEETLAPSSTYVDEKVPNQPNLILDGNNDWSVLLASLTDGYEYYVKEIKIDGVPVEEAFYQVSYENNEGITNGLITVKNQNMQEFGDFELPATGGRGAHFYRISGLLFITAALIYNFIRNRRERRTNS